MGCTPIVTPQQGLGFEFVSLSLFAVVWTCIVCNHCDAGDDICPKCKRDAPRHFDAYNCAPLIKCPVYLQAPEPKKYSLGCPGVGARRPPAAPSGSSSISLSLSLSLSIYIYMYMYRLAVGKDESMLACTTGPGTLTVCVGFKPCSPNEDGRLDRRARAPQNALRR